MSVFVPGAREDTCHFGIFQYNGEDTQLDCRMQWGYYSRDCSIPLNQLHKRLFTSSLELSGAIYQGLKRIVQLPLVCSCPPPSLLAGMHMWWLELWWLPLPEEKPNAEDDGTYTEHRRSLRPWWLREAALPTSSDCLPLDVFHMRNFFLV